MIGALADGAMNLVIALLLLGMLAALTFAGVQLAHWLIGEPQYPVNPRAGRWWELAPHDRFERGWLANVYHNERVRLQDALDNEREQRENAARLQAMRDEQRIAGSLREDRRAARQRLEESHKLGRIFSSDAWR